MTPDGDLELTPEEQRIRLLGRIDAMQELTPLLQEADEIMEALRLRPYPDDVQAQLQGYAQATLQLSGMLAKITAWAEQAGHDIKAEMALTRAQD